MSGTVITGFSRFLHYPDNPSEILVTDLMTYLKSPDFKMRIIDTSFDSVDYFLNDLSLDPPEFLIMFGQDVNATGIKIEQYAYNEVNSEKPDIFGITKSGDISSKSPHRLMSNLHLEKLVNLIETAYLSNDPGRYVCNYLYFKSLDYLRAKTKIVFIHVPFFAEQTDCLTQEGISRPEKMLSRTQILQEVQDIIHRITDNQN